MRPTILNGHERPITRIIYNCDGDLIFTAAKNQSVCVWYSVNGERLGTYDQHDGAVWWLDVDWTTTMLLTASADWSCKIWDVETGKSTNTYNTANPVRTCGISYCGNLIFLTTDDTGKKNCEVIALDKRDSSHMSQKSCIFKITSPDDSKVTGAIWGPVNRNIICGHESGAVTMIDVSSGKCSKRITPHKGPVTDMQMHLTLPMFITGSKDHNAKLFSAYDLDCIRTYTTERPINSAAISPNRDHVLLGGGQEAHEVTTTAVGQGKFDVRFYHLIYEEEFGRVKGHFGPVNSVAFSPDGSGFATGGEEGYVRLHTFDSEYNDLDQRLF